MKKWIYVLSGLLVVQLVVAVVVNLTGEDYEAFQAEEKLLAFDRNAVDGLRIEAGEDQLVLVKQDKQWLLPELGDFPTSKGSVDGLLDKLETLEKGWPVATTGSAPRRFKVDDDLFERKLTLLSNDATLAELYVGTSPGYRKVHVRPAGEDAVFAVTFESWQANAQADDWIDKGKLTIDEGEVKQLEMPGVVLNRSEDGELQVSDLVELEQTNAEEARALLGKLAGLQIQSLLGTEAKPEYRQDEPALEIKVSLNSGDALTYRFSKPKEGAYYVLKRSDIDHFFKIAEFAVDPMREASREKLVQTEQPEKSPGDDAQGEAQQASVEDGAVGEPN